MATHKFQQSSKPKKNKAAPVLDSVKWLRFILAGEKHFCEKRPEFLTNIDNFQNVEKISWLFMTFHEPDEKVLKYGHVSSSNGLKLIFFFFCKPLHIKALLF